MDQDVHIVCQHLRRAHNGLNDVGIEIPIAHLGLKVNTVLRLEARLFIKIFQALICISS